MGVWNPRRGVLRGTRATSFLQGDFHEAVILRSPSVQPSLNLTSGMDLLLTHVQGFD